MLRVTVNWLGFIGAPGYTNFYFDGLLEGGTVAQQKHDQVRNAMVKLLNHVPTAVNWVFDPTVTQLDPVTGELQDERTVATPQQAVTGQGGVNYSAPSGLCVSWKTNTIVGGKRLRGRTFFVPLGAAAYDGQGNLATLPQAAAQDFINAMVAPPISAATDFVIWSRPRKAGVRNGVQVEARAGSVGKVTAGTVADKAAILTSRRD